MEFYIYKAIVRVRNIVKLARCRDVANLDIGVHNCAGPKGTGEDCRQS
jgi:hypothetical protein